MGSFLDDLLLFAAVVMPEPAGMILLLGVTFSAWLAIVSFFGGYLLKKEIGDHLRAGVSDPSSGRII